MMEYVKAITSLLAFAVSNKKMLHAKWLTIVDSYLVNPRRACAARVRYLSVCLSVCYRSSSYSVSFISTCNERHLRHYYRLFLDFNSWIFEKAFRSKVMA